MESGTFSGSDIQFKQETEEEKSQRLQIEKQQLIRKRVMQKKMDFKKSQAQNVDGCLDLYSDPKYKECEGFYIILRGYVDILSLKDNSVVHSLRNMDFFGEAKFLQ